MNTTDESEIVYCSACNGSGEGAYDGSICSTCKGRGEVVALVADLAYNADKDAGGPARRNQERAFALQMAQPQTNEGFFV